MKKATQIKFLIIAVISIIIVSILANQDLLFKSRIVFYSYIDPMLYDAIQTLRLITKDFLSIRPYPVMLIVGMFPIVMIWACFYLVRSIIEAKKEKARLDRIDQYNNLATGDKCIVRVDGQEVECIFKKHRNALTFSCATTSGNRLLTPSRFDFICKL